MSESEQADLAGKWDVEAAVEGGESYRSVLTVKKEDGKWAATMEMQDNEIEFHRVSVQGEMLTIERDVERDGQSGVIGAKAKLDKKGALVGEWFMRTSGDVDGGGNDWKATRSLESMFKGDWKVVAKTDNGEMEQGMVVSHLFS